MFDYFLFFMIKKTFIFFVANHLYLHAILIQQLFISLLVLKLRLNKFLFQFIECYFFLVLAINIQFFFTYERLNTFQKKFIFNKFRFSCVQITFRKIFKINLVFFTVLIIHLFPKLLYLFIKSKKPYLSVADLVMIFHSAFL